MKNHLFDILRCPISKNKLSLVSNSSFNELRSKIQNKELVHIDNSEIKFSISALLKSSDGKYLYAIENNILILMPHLAIVKAENTHSQEYGFSKRTQEFYELIGWQKSKNDNYEDAIIYEDLRPVSRDYIYKAHLRVNKWITKQGVFFMDSASGPVQFNEYLSYSEGFNFHICIDISMVALKEAQKKLKEKGIYILADLTNLPFIQNVIDSAVSLHTIYHIPRENQVEAIKEFYRVLKPGAKAAVVYSWGRYSLVMKFLIFPLIIYRKLFEKVSSKLYQNTVENDEKPQIYFHAHHHFYFNKKKLGFKFKIACWRFLSIEAMKIYIHKNFFGKAILKLIYWMENKFPYLFGVLGEYPIFLITKRDSN